MSSWSNWQTFLYFVAKYKTMMVMEVLLVIFADSQNQDICTVFISTVLAHVPIMNAASMMRDNNIFQFMQSRAGVNGHGIIVGE